MVYSLDLSTEKKAEVSRILNTRKSLYKWSGNERLFKKKDEVENSQELKVHGSYYSANMQIFMKGPLSVFSFHFRMILFLKNNLKPFHVRASSYLFFSSAPKEEEKEKKLEFFGWR